MTLSVARGFVLACPDDRDDTLIKRIQKLPKGDINIFFYATYEEILREIFRCAEMHLTKQDLALFDIQKTVLENSGVWVAPKKSTEQPVRRQIPSIFVEKIDDLFLHCAEKIFTDYSHLLFSNNKIILYQHTHFTTNIKLALQSVFCNEDFSKITTSEQFTTFGDKFVDKIISTIAELEFF